MQRGIAGAKTWGKVFVQCLRQEPYERYEDCLVVPKPEPLISYVLSCHGNQGQYITERYKEFRTYVKRKTDRGFHITKEAGLFICKIV